MWILYVNGQIRFVFWKLFTTHLDRTQLIYRIKYDILTFTNYLQCYLPILFFKKLKKDVSDITTLTQTTFWLKNLKVLHIVALPCLWKIFGTQTLKDTVNLQEEQSRFQLL